MAEITRNWDKTDMDAAREGEALRKIHEYSPTRPNVPSPYTVPNRVFNTDLCQIIENLSPQEYRKIFRNGGLKNL
jgi:hypothetical protein